jgi:predicted acyl esterase
VHAQTPEKETIAIPMRDGNALAADLFMPAGYSRDKFPQGVPAILICTPYDKSKDNAAMRSWRDVFLRNDYAFVVQDMRGFYASKDAGKGVPRHHDGSDTIEWLAKQPWCNGKVGMFGYSHLGAAQYEATVTAPPHLACAIPAQAPGNYYTDSYFPEKFRKADMEAILRGPFTSRTQQLINRRTRSGKTSNISQFNTPMLHSAGWYDFFKEGAIEMFAACQKDGGPGARGKQKLLIGPWGHGTLQEENPGKPLRLDGGLAYPANSKLDWEKGVWMPWFDHWLKGKKADVFGGANALYYLMGDVDDPRAPGNKWVKADTFPPESRAVRYYVHSDHSLQTAAPTKESDSIQYVYDPRDPVPTVGRVHARLPVKGPYDQRAVEKRPDVVLFTTPKLTEPLEIVGQVRVKLWASTDRKDTDFTAKLTDVYPDGRSMLVLDGIVKGRYRNTYRKEEFLTPGEVYEFEIDLGYIAIAIAPGHRLRLAISSSNFDRFDINPNTGEPYGDHAVTRELLAKRLRGYQSVGEPQHTKTLPAKNTIHMSRQHPTHVILPITSIAR